MRTGHSGEWLGTWLGTPHFDKSLCGSILEVSHRGCGPVVGGVYVSRVVGGCGVGIAVGWMGLAGWGFVVGVWLGWRGGVGGWLLLVRVWGMVVVVGGGIRGGEFGWGRREERRGEAGKGNPMAGSESLAFLHTWDIWVGRWVGGVEGDTCVASLLCLCCVFWGGGGGGVGHDAN